ncbi:CHASE2 domain-containing protein [Bordetella petrii]|uniref:CHASE2 domain-containing protein n=1 Tax=Bordetella petrii TaxID=94624 RepID=UPI00372E3FCC
MAERRYYGPRSGLLLTAFLVALAALLGTINGLGRFDQILYDRAISLAQRPAAQDVLLVAMDDQSIEALGRWPWPRVMHAALLDRLREARAVGLDIVFTEASPPGHRDDQILAEAIRRHGKVVLPVVLDNLEAPTQASLPLQPLAQAAAGLGYINIELDNDGVVRRATWTRDIAGSRWDHFVLAMLKTGGEAARAEALLDRLPDSATTLIPYSGPPGHLRAVSYLSVLRGEVPPAMLRDKYVLVGAWATGIGDVYPAPVSHSASGMSGVEIMGNLLHSTREGLLLQYAAPWQTALASAIPVLLLCLALPRLSPRQAVMCSVALLALALAAALAALRWANLWLPPGAALLGVAVCYPLWSWRSQEAALRYMDGEMKRLRLEYPPVLDEAGPQGGRIGRSLDHYVGELDRTLSRVRNLRRFLADGLDGMPDATLVIDLAGRLQFRNRPAVLYFLHLSIRPPRAGQVVAPALEQAFSDQAARQVVHQALHAYGAAQANGDTAAQRISVELRDRAGQDVLLRCAPIRNATGGYAGTVVTLSDITAIRQAERRRDETLRFISHDMRAPQNSILALVALNQHDHDGSRPPSEALARIAHLAKRTLRLVDDFIQLTRAESMDIAHVTLDLADLVREAADEFWAAAQARGITLGVQVPPGPALANGDQTLIMRAISNLLDNAIKYSPDGSPVQLRVQAGADAWDIEIEDAGPGIAPDDQARLFEPFFRTGDAHRSSTVGSGLGLAFVRTVAQRHGGQVAIHSQPGSGARFVLSLPKALAEADYEDGARA